MSDIPIDMIAVGDRDRHDFGSLDTLAASLEAIGMLHPIVVTDDHRLIAGQRRLAAAASLGWTTVPVTVVDVSTVADLLRAEQDENECRKALSPVEAARARERRAVVLRRMAGLRKGQAPGRPQGEKVSSSKLDEETDANARATRKLAATGTGYSGSTLDKVDLIRRTADDETLPEPVRDVARQELQALSRSDAKVDASHRKVTEAQAYAQAVASFPDLTHYAARPRRAISLAAQLRTFQEPELSMRLDNLRKSIAAEQRAEPVEESDEPDWKQLADEMFLALNEAARVISTHGGADTFDKALPHLHPLMVTQWRDLTGRLGETCGAFTNLTRQRLRSVQ